MRKYYLFILNDEYYSKYKYNSYMLYKIFECLFKMKSNDLCKGFLIYNKICITYKKEIIYNYLNSKYKLIYNNGFYKIESNREETYIRINNTHIVIITNKNPYMFKLLNIYSKKIFVCDFENCDYFFLNDIVESKFYTINSYTKIGD